MISNMKKHFSLITLLFAGIIFFTGCGGAKSTTKEKPETPAVPKKPSGKPQLEKGMELYKARDYEGAKKNLRSATDLDLSKSERTQAYKHLGFIFAMQKNQAEATKAFFDAFTSDDGFELESAEMGNPAWTPAYEAAQKQFTLASASGNDLLSKGKDAYSKRNYDEALSYLETAVKKTDLEGNKRADAYKLLAFAYALRKRPVDAKNAFRKAFEVNKNFELDKSEYGNPVWTPLYDEVKNTIKK